MKFLVFTRKYPNVNNLLPLDNEWKVCETIEKALEPFYNYIRIVSYDRPYLNDAIRIMWGLDNLFYDVGQSKGPFVDIGAEYSSCF